MQVLVTVVNLNPLDSDDAIGVQGTVAINDFNCTKLSMYTLRGELFRCIFRTKITQCSVS